MLFLLMFGRSRIYIFYLQEMDNNLKKIADRLKSVDKTAISAHPDDDDDFGKFQSVLTQMMMMTLVSLQSVLTQMMMMTVSLQSVLTQMMTMTLVSLQSVLTQMMMMTLVSSAFRYVQRGGSRYFCMAFIEIHAHVMICTFSD